MISFVSSDFFARSPLLALPIAALALFMIVFVATTLRAAFTDEKRIDRLAHLPLGDDGEAREPNEVHHV